MELFYSSCFCPLLNVLHESFSDHGFPVCCGHGSPPPDSGEAVRLPLAFRFSYVGAGRRRWFVGLRLSRLFPSFPPALRSAGECGFFRAIPPQSFAAIAMGAHGSRAGQDSPCAPLPCRQGSPGEGKCKEISSFSPLLSRSTFAPHLCVICAAAGPPARSEPAG